MLPYLAGIRDKLQFCLSFSEGEAHKQMKMKVEAVSYVVNAYGRGRGLSGVRQEASESLDVKRRVSGVSLPTNLRLHGLQPVRAIDSVQSMESTTGISSGTTIERMLPSLLKDFSHLHCVPR